LCVLTPDAVTITVTPAAGAPSGSVTTPWMPPVVGDCACASPPSKHNHTTIVRKLTVPPPRSRTFKQPRTRSQGRSQHADRCGLRVDDQRLFGAARADPTDLQGVGLAAFERPPLVGGAHVLVAVARPLAGQDQQRVHRIAELVRDRPTVAVVRGWLADDRE